MSAFDPSVIDVEDFLSCLEIESRQATEDEIIFSCPFPNHAGGDTNPSAYMNVHTTAFYCHSCHEKGNAVHFTQKVLSVSPLAAIRMLRQRYQPGAIDPDARNMVDEVRKVLETREDPEPTNYTLDLSLVEKYAVDWEKVHEAGEEAPESLRYMLDRGFEWETLEEWSFGYDAGTDRIVFPVCDEMGDLVGFKGRAWRSGHKPKYLILGDAPGRPARFGFPRYLKSLVVFGLHEAVTNFELLEEGAPLELIVCEGELNAIALWQAGYRNAVAVNGSELSARQIQLLGYFAERLVVFFDSDDAGDHGTQRIVDELAHVLPISIVPEHEGDPASMTADEIHQTISSARGYAAWKLIRSLSVGST